MNREEHAPASDILDRELRALRDLLDARFTAAERAVGAQAEVLNYRFEQTNEWRAQLDRERIAFVRTDRVDALAADLQRLERWHSETVGALGLLRILASGGALSLLLELLRLARVLS